jgi:hypothetical protein
VLSVLLYSYSLIMGTSDAVLPWALKILMIALVTIAVFIYRKPFSHLFSAVGYGTIGSQERAEYSLREAGATFRRSTLDAATVAVPGVAGYRAARWARRNPGQAATLAAGVASGAGAAAAASAAEAAARAGTVGSASSDAYASRLRPDAPPSADGEGEASTSRRVVAGAGSSSVARRNMPEADNGAGRVAPPLDLPPRTDGGANGSAGTASGWSRGAGRSAVGGSAGPRTRAASPGPVGTTGGTGASRTPARSRGSAGLGPARSAPPVRGGSGQSGSGQSGSGRSGSAQSRSGSGPAWPGSGWPGAGGTRQRSGTAPRPLPPTPPAEAADRGGTSASGGGQDETRSVPFWLRPIRRDK